MSVRMSTSRCRTTATLRAATVWGALRGLETFSQLVRFDFDARGYEIADAPISKEMLLKRMLSQLTNSPKT